MCIEVTDRMEQEHRLRECRDLFNNEKNILGWVYFASGYLQRTQTNDTQTNLGHTGLEREGGGRGKVQKEEEN